ncbi:hypothetical protein DPM19_26440 [Actinomadura craniellae]|uniref:histidine kinase n=1 Tax=Actinomadura craniellae TaxID=2231787 RepID=A0A365GZL8_9ACTN|nr:ATP-binding protein [Actinomadura craniellae]RAY12257.1 hypothetical protein DPM19_26440 [Actinomadura craniellae]
MQILVLAEQLRPALDRLENDEEDPERLQQLYEVDHAVTRMRRTARELRVLADRGGDELSGHTASLVNVIREAQSAIEHYTRISIGVLAELAVVAYAADDAATLLAALLDNATRYSPGVVTVSAHLLPDGGVMIRVEDDGIGIGPTQLANLNAMLAGPVPPIDERAGAHTGFPIVHRLARKHGFKVSLACRPAPRQGTTAMVTVPAALLCEIPAETAPATAEDSTAHLQASHRPTPAPQPPASAPETPGALPRRQRGSLRGDAPAPAAPVQATDSAAAARSFAADLEAFAGGETQARRPPTNDSSEEEPR